MRQAHLSVRSLSFVSTAPSQPPVVIAPTTQIPVGDQHERNRHLPDRDGTAMSNDKHQQDQPTLWDQPPPQPAAPQPSRRQAATPPPAHANVPEQPAIGSTGERLWTAADVGAYLGVPVKTIYTWRANGRGPKGFRVGKHLRWRIATVFEWSLDQERGQ